MTFVKRYWLVGLRYAGLILGLGLFIKQLLESVIKFTNSGPHPVNLYFIVLAIIMMVVIYMVQVRLWMSAMKSIGCVITLRNAIKGYWITFLPRYIPGGIWGYLGRNDWLYRELNIASAFSNSGSLIEILMVVTGALFVLIVTTWKSINLPLGLLFGLSSIFLIGYILSKAARLVKKTDHKYLLKFLNLPGVTINFRHYLIGNIYSVINWIFYGCSIYFLLLGFSIENSHSMIYSIGLLSQVFTISWLIGFFIIVIPGGLGIRELVLTALLTSIVGVNAEISNTTAVTLRLITLIVELFWILFALFLPSRGTSSRDNPNVLLNK